MIFRFTSLLSLTYLRLSRDLGGGLGGELGDELGVELGGELVGGLGGELGGELGKVDLDLVVGVSALLRQRLPFSLCLTTVPCQLRMRRVTSGYSCSLCSSSTNSQRPGKLIE